MHLFPDNVSLWPLALVVLAASLFFVLVLRALRRPVRVFPPGPPVVLASPRLADQAAREVNAIVAELRAHQFELQQLHAEELAAVEVRARRAEARAAATVSPSDVGQAVAFLRTVAHDLADVAASLSGQVKALQRERAAKRVEALVGKDALLARGPLDTLASESEDDRKTAEGPAVTPKPADEWDDQTQFVDANGSGRRPAIRRAAS